MVTEEVLLRSSFKSENLFNPTNKALYPTSPSTVRVWLITFLEKVFSEEIFDKCEVNLDAEAVLQETVSTAVSGEAGSVNMATWVGEAE
ncbi:hypothetical protein TorRG33x02_086660 [Trema orientale]|uniref:Uncharacterized protein n=1 Tax=Trema orientale TaxID=63057 RepID=A0A2P5FCK0_TREOI|nr:hypothetical protein TorRG33x02_086660 [Trema orientale]